MVYAQCELVKDSQVQVSWLPEHFATVGRLLKLKERGAWEEGWKVRRVFGKLTEAAVILQRDLHKTHRLATDI